MAIDQFFSRDHENLYVPPHAYCAVACNVLWGFLCEDLEPIFTKLDSRVSLDFFRKQHARAEWKFNLVRIDQFFVADRENLAAAARYACGGTCNFLWGFVEQIFTKL